MLTPETVRECESLAQLDISNINYIKEFKKIASEENINKNNICLIGSSPLALFGIRENEDLDIAALPPERNVLKKALNSNRNIELSKKNSLNLIDISDYELITNEDFHFRHEGFNILPLEIAMSIKGAKRRSKDLMDIKKIYEYNYPMRSEWEWDLVRVVPVWERQSANEINPLWSPIQLMRRSVELLRSEGTTSTAIKTIKFIRRQLFSKNSQISSTVGRYINQSVFTIGDFFKQQDPPYSIAYILAAQFDKSGDFQRHDLISAILSIENNDREYGISKRDYDTTSDICISRNGKLTGGIWRLAKKIVDEIKNGTTNLLDMTITPTISKDSPIKPTGEDWLANRLPSNCQREFNMRRQQLLKQSGVLFSIVLWPAIKQNHEDIIQKVEKEFNIEDMNEYNVKSDLRKLIEDVYSIDERNERWFRDKKIHELLKYKPKMRILTVQIPQPTFKIEGDQLMCREIYDTKIELRKIAQKLDSNYVYGSCIHSTDTFQHNIHMQKVIKQIERGYY